MPALVATAPSRVPENATSSLKVRLSATFAAVAPHVFLCENISLELELLSYPLFLLFATLLQGYCIMRLTTEILAGNYPCTLPGMVQHLIGTDTFTPCQTFINSLLFLYSQLLKC